MITILVRCFYLGVLSSDLKKQEVQSGHGGFRWDGDTIHLGKELRFGFFGGQGAASVASVVLINTDSDDLVRDGMTKPN